VNPALRRVVAALDQTGWAAVVADGQWTLTWISEETKTLLGETDPEKLGIGEHLLTQ
jgi:hypothetical protein